MNVQLGTHSLPIIGESRNMMAVFDIVQKAAASDSTVMIFGESGTGKELIARCLHHNSPRAKNPFVAVNCAAIPHDLLESELFGYEKGAFTGAVNTRIGRLELANEGTVFLDEIGDMQMSLQVKLLRVLAEREIDRIGGNKSIPIDIRVIAATHRNLEDGVAKGTFREDLFYRLNIIPLHMPPLRERDGDVRLLAEYYLDHFNKARSRSIRGISPEAMQVLSDYSWPGNIRELANFIERMVVLCSGDVITIRDLPAKVLGDVPEEKWAPLNEKEPEGSAALALQDSLRQSYSVGIPEEGMNLKAVVESFEKELILEALEKTNWVKNKAAGLLGLNRTTLVEKLKKMNIKRDGQP